MIGFVIQLWPMLIVRHLKLTMALLAGKPNHSDRSPGALHRVFSRWPKTPTGESEDRVFIRTDLPRWEWAFLEARDALELEDVAVSAILPCRWYSVARTNAYIRKFKRGSKMCSEKFESLPGGQVIEMKFTLSKHLPPGTDGNGRFTRAPDEEEFDAMLSHIGEYLGISEWGHARDYGRFEIIKKKKKNAEPKPAAPYEESGDELD